MNKPLLSLCLMAMAEAGSAHPVDADVVIVLPFHTIGVSDETARAAREIMVQELLGRGLQFGETDGSLPGPGPEACHEPGCAADLGVRFGADRVLFASLLKLGDKIVVNANAVDCASRAVTFADNLSALTLEDLDTVMRRVAIGVATGKSTSTPTVTTVITDETLEPRRQASRGGIEFRGGFVFPAGGSYGRADRLTTLNVSYVRETEDILVETTVLLGAAWGDGAVEWAPLDVFVAKIFGDGDFCPYLGAGTGVRILNVEGERRAETYGAWSSSYYESQSSTTMSLDVGAGVMVLRTFDFSLQFEARYHYVFEDFEQIGRKGAHGLSLSFGTGR